MSDTKRTMLYRPIKPQIKTRTKRDDRHSAKQQLRKLAC